MLQRGHLRLIVECGLYKFFSLYLVGAAYSAESTVIVFNRVAVLVQLVQQKHVENNIFNVFIKAD